MRSNGLVISIMIIIVCVSIEVVNTQDEAFFSEMGRSLFGWKTEAPIKVSDLPYVGSEAEFNQSLYTFTEPKEQPSGLSLSDFWTIISWLTTGVKFIIDTLINSTIGFFWFIRGFGRSDITIVPTEIALGLTAIVYIIYIITLIEILTGREIL